MSALKTTVEISIRAPARGATLRLPIEKRVDIFQSALPRGERPDRGKHVFNFIMYFNPRSREGSDMMVTAGQKSIQISIRAPARGATSWDTNGEYICKISIRAPARGATHEASGRKGQVQISIRAPARGATLAIALQADR